MENNFDFFIGKWTSEQRRLRKVLAGCDEWDEFTGVTRCWSIFDGAGNIDEVTFPTLGWGGVTLRLYDRERDEWSLHWASSRSGLAQGAQVGRFGADGIGIFTGDDVIDGQPIEVIYRWSGITAESCRWEQAFSADGGATWETNWVAEWRRLS